MLAYPIKVWRESLCYSKSHLSKVLGVSTKTIAKWESGKSMPSTMNLIRLGELFGCGTDGIFLPK